MLVPFEELAEVSNFFLEMSFDLSLNPNVSASFVVEVSFLC